MVEHAPLRRWQIV